MLWQPCENLGIALLLLVACVCFFAGIGGDSLAADEGGPGYAGGGSVLLPFPKLPFRCGWFLLSMERCALLAGP